MDHQEQESTNRRRSQGLSRRKRLPVLGALLLWPLLVSSVVAVAARAPQVEDGEVSLVTGSHHHNASHIYRLKAGPLNGRLMGLMEVNNKSANCRQQQQQDDPQDTSHQLEASSPNLKLINSAQRPKTPAAQHQSQAPTKSISQALSEANSESTAGANSSRQADGGTQVLGDTILSLIDDFDSKIVTGRTRAQLSCDSGEMVLRLNFSEPYKGVVYPDHNRLSPCRFFGDGHLNYELRLPLRGCGTRQVSPRVFINDVIVRFHKTLELEEDEVKTLICRYPPPLAPLPADSAAPATTSNIHINNRPGDYAGGGGNQLEQEGGPLDAELIDPSRRSHNNLGGGIETASENLVVAPAADPALLRPRHSGNLLELQQQQPPTSARRPGAPPSGPGGAIGPLERLSSVELLFLISALMFLVLFALALATTLYCVRRRRESRDSKRRAGAMLSRRLARSPLAPAGAHQHHRQHYSPHHQAPWFGPTPVAAASASQPPSPESDLSARGLLAADAPRRHHYLGGHTNQAYAPENMQYAVFGRQHQLERAGRRSGYAGANHHYSHHSIGRPQPPPPPPPTNHNQNMLLSLGTSPDDGAGELYQLSAANQHLLRAKSLSSVQQQQHRASQYEPPYVGQQTFSAANYRKHHFLGMPVKDHHASHHLEQVHTFSSESSDSGGGGGGRGNPAEEKRPMASILRAHKPKIVLKSIEDSYITNLTEIHHQEYLKRDSRRPLSLAKWRSMQPQGGDNHPAQPSQEQAMWFSPTDGASSTGSTPDEATLTRQQTDSRYANLRSLTELDVNFAKTALLLPSKKNAARAYESVEHGIRPAASMGHLAAKRRIEQDGDEDGSWRPPAKSQADASSANTNTARRRSSSVPDIVQSQLGNQQQRRPPGQRQQQSPDLILSPDYDLTTTRLELEPNSSHNSVSYV